MRANLNAIILIATHPLTMLDNISHYVIANQEHLNDPAFVLKWMLVTCESPAGPNFTRVNGFIIDVKSRSKTGLTLYRAGLSKNGRSWVKHECTRGKLRNRIIELWKEQI